MNHATQNIFSVVKYALKFHTNLYQKFMNHVSIQMFLRWQDYSVRFNCKITYKQEEEDSFPELFDKPYSLTLHFTGIYLSKMMRDMPSFAKIMVIKETSNHTGNTPNRKLYAEITAIKTSGMDRYTYHLNEKEEVIFLLIDSKESDSPPWTLLKDHNRLYYNGSYPYRIYHDQSFYENILIKNGGILLI